MTAAIRLEGSVIRLSGVSMPVFLECLESCEVNSSSGIEPDFLAATKGQKLINAGIHLYCDLATAQRVFARMSRQLMPPREGTKRSRCLNRRHKQKVESGMAKHKKLSKAQVRIASKALADVLPHICATGGKPVKASAIEVAEALIAGMQLIARSSCSTR